MRITALLLLIAVSLSVRGQAVPEAKAECEALLNEAMPFAEKMLREHGEFYPYGYEMNATGDIKLVAGYTGTDPRRPGQTPPPLAGSKSPTVATG